MDYIKETSISELKEKYGQNHGFILLSSNKSSDRSIENLAQSIKSFGITREFPVLVTRLEQGVVFVYDEFDGPRFWRLAEQAEMILGIKTFPLCFFLRDVEDKPL